ncbi:hypothetical protein PoB_003741700 [Plakobranchus ocellatus]|uniref:Uncharacterized protein n=1 Tax=Plakobranchus ocellatus TaxID=259542 RepID=A0AAV4AUB6_9GAST|nr:hypothetical protein PoB_003741700 [Plakobranchus ocellatus]
MPTPMGCSYSACCPTGRLVLTRCSEESLRNWSVFMTSGTGGVTPVISDRDREDQWSLAGQLAYRFSK